MNIKQIFRSKTVDFNVIVPALAGLAMALGIPVSGEVVAGILAIGNCILRFFTKKSLADK